MTRPLLCLLALMMLVGCWGVERTEYKCVDGILYYRGGIEGMELWKSSVHSGQTVKCIDADPDKVKP